MLWATVAPRRSGGIDTRTKQAWKVMSPRKHLRCYAATNYIRKAVQRGRGTAVASRLGGVVMVNTHANTVAVIVPSRHQRRAPLLPNISTPAADLGHAWKSEPRLSGRGSQWYMYFADYL